MQLWQMDIVGGVWLVDAVTGVLREAKVVTGVDDHSRFCVIAAVVERATGRAVCLALAEALARFGVPEEILTDNGKQFTDRFGKGGEVLFDKICRHNGITHRLTQPASPTTTGKVERFHLTLRRELLDDHGPFESLAAAQAAVDACVARVQHRPAAPGAGPQRRSARRTGSPRSRQQRTGPAAGLAARRRWLPHPAPARGQATGADDDGAVEPGHRFGSWRQRWARWTGRVRPGRARHREHAARRQTVLARPGPGRPGGPVLGRLRPDPPVHRRHPGQDRPLAPDA